MTRPTLAHYDPAWQGDCVLGVGESIGSGYAAQDVNAQCLADDVFAAAHWGHVGPRGDQNPWRGAGVNSGAAMSTIASDQWVRMLPYDSTRPERPATLTGILAACAGQAFTPAFEIKPGPGTHKSKPYLMLKADAVASQVPCLVMTIQSYGATASAREGWEASAKLRMVAAGRAGLPRMLLWRHHIPPDSDWWDLIEAVKGAPADQLTPASVIRVPGSATAETARKVLAKVTARADWKPYTPTPEVPPVTDNLWLPSIVRLPLAIDHARDPYIIPVGAVFHVAVSEADSLLGMYQRRTDGIESTGYIRRDGTIEQYRPVNVECDAQLAGNSWTSGGKRYGLTSWETQGLGPGEWTKAQMASIMRIISWLHTEHDAPLRRNPLPQSGGFGYHRMFTAWNPNAHSCPGDDRVKQFENTIVPWMAHGGTQEEVVTPQDKQEIIDGVVAAMKGLVGDTVPAPTTADPKNTVRVDTALGRILKKLGA